MKNPRVWVAVVSAAVVVYAVVGLSGRSSPGPLASVHGNVKKLTGFNSCAQCHGGWFGSMNEACLSCHETIGRHIEQNRGLHGKLAGEKAKDCATCHSDHHGEDFQIVNRQSFALAGVPDPLAFDHAAIGYVMEGRHLELSCGECHENANVVVLPEGESRYVGLDRDCETCHEDPHKPSYVLSCSECHGQKSWKDLAPVDHDKHLPLIGGHGGVSCVTCHKENTPHALANTGRGARPSPRDCRSCHESPHAQPFVDGVARIENAASGQSCVVCHKAEHETFRDERLTVSAPQHGASGFPLAKPHQDVRCQDCHDSTRPEFAARYPGRKADDCKSCHKDPHGGQFARGPRRQECADCHERTHFAPHAFTVKRHEAARLRLDGAHLDVECNACHKVERPDTPRVFRGSGNYCSSCHKDAHRGFFAKHMKRFENTEYGQCAHCHTTTRFADLRTKTFDHAAWTDFPIEGAHAQATCEACHPRSEKPDARGRRFGRVDRHFGTYEGCATCHTDPHDGVFDRKGLPQVMKGKRGCARCHSENSFRVFPDGFDHGLWTGFKLDGAHTKAECATCHVPLRRPTKAGRTWSHAKGGRCADCHDDPHDGQFKRGGFVRCERCHSSAESFDRLQFRHNLDSRFPLDKAHENVACAKCHKPYRSGTKRFIRYRPMGRECADCHSPQKDPLRRR